MPSFEELLELAERATLLDALNGGQMYRAACSNRWRDPKLLAQLWSGGWLCMWSYEIAQALVNGAPIPS